MVIDQENSLKPRLPKKYSFVHRIHSINGLSAQFLRIFNQSELFVKKRDFDNLFDN